MKILIYLIYLFKFLEVTGKHNIVSSVKQLFDYSEFCCLYRLINNIWLVNNCYYMWNYEFDNVGDEFNSVRSVNVC